MPNAEVISIGDELTSGQSLDTNTQWLSQRLGELGIWVVYHTTVGDHLPAVVDVFRTAIGRADVVVATGGLGPTDDDLTREALAATVDRPLVCDESALEHIRWLFARRGREMPEQNQRQAMLPEGSRLVTNPHGTAPGIALEIPRQDASPVRVYSLPGVPAEMRQMWEQTLAEELRPLAGDRVILTRAVKVFGAGESAVEAKLPGLIRRGRHPRVGITASEATITLRVAAEGATESECLAAMEPTLATIHEQLGELVYGYDDDQLEDVAVRLLQERGKTLATVEWASGGTLAERLQSVADAGPVTLGGMVIGSQTALAGLLDGPDRQFSNKAAASAALAEAMALAVRRRFNTDYGLAVGPFPETDGPDETPGQVAYAVATEEGAKSIHLPSASHPALRNTFCAKTALAVLRRVLLDLPD